MLYNSTQNAAEVVSAAQAIAQGISKDGGLFVPQEFPKYSAETFNELLSLITRAEQKKFSLIFFLIYRRRNQRLC